MSARQSAIVEKALRLIGKPRKSGGVHTPYSAAKASKIALSTIYRALNRQVQICVNSQCHQPFRGRGGYCPHCVKKHGS